MGDGLVTPSSRGRLALLVAVGVIVAAVVIGVVIAVHPSSAPDKSQLQQITEVVDRVPLPPGSTLTDEHSTRHTDPTSGDVYVVPPGTGADGGGIELRWDATGLTVDLAYDNLPRSDG